MKKWLLPIILILLCVVIYLIYAFKPVYVYDLSKNKEPNAQKILYEYVLRDLDSTPKTLEENFNIVFDNVYAFEYDLNDDGEKEVIGIVYSTIYYGSLLGYHTFILQKQSEIYEDISTFGYEPYNGRLIILKTKKNNEHKILLPNKQCVCEFDNKLDIPGYTYVYTWNILGYIKHRIWLWKINKKYN